MAFSAAEKQRRYREKRSLDLAKLAANRKKDLQRYHKNKKLINDLPTKKQKAERRKWRNAKVKQNQRIASHLASIPDSPPLTPSPVQQPGPPLMSSPLHQPEASISVPKKRGRKLMKKARSKINRENEKLKVKIVNLTRSNEKYRKRATRLKSERQQGKQPETPNSKTQQFIKECLPGPPTPRKKKVMRQLFIHNTVAAAVQSAYKTGDFKTKNNLKQIMISGVMRKYRHRWYASKLYLGLQNRARALSAKKREMKTKKRIETFYERDDVSRASAGKKECVTRKKEKRQKRYLLDTMTNLCNKFNSESVRKVSFTTFARYRPFHVITPQVEDRDTCVCYQHGNVLYLANKLFEIKAFQEKDPQVLAKTIACDYKNKECMYGQCLVCKNKEVVVDFKVAETTDELTWFQWVRKTEEVETKKGKKKEIKKTVKEEQRGTMKELVTKFQAQMKTFKKHIYNISQQYKAYRSCLDNLKPNQAAVHIDYSEKYSCKLSEEVQGHHFGASRNQVTLHTGVMYIGQAKPLSFCTVSPCKDQDPPAIWAHLTPVITHFKRIAPEVDVIHFFSDGPSTQYRQKKNFFFFEQEIPKHGFKWATWSFFEAGHGKGAADGIGGTLKRAADQKVAHGHDITDAYDFFKTLDGTTQIKLFMTSEEEVIQMKDLLPPNIPVLKGTMNVHQVALGKEKTLAYRDVSCYCEKQNSLCTCFPTKIYSLEVQPTKRKGKRARKDTMESECSTSEDNEYSQHSDDQEYEDIVQVAAGNSLTEKLIMEQVTPDSIKKGVHMLVLFYGGNRKKTMYKYVVVALDELDENDEIKVMSLKLVGSTGKLFRADDEDVSYIDYEQILAILPNPNIKMKGNRVFYEFESTVDVYERA